MIIRFNPRAPMAGEICQIQRQNMLTATFATQVLTGSLREARGLTKKEEPCPRSSAQWLTLIKMDILMQLEIRYCLWRSGHFLVPPIRASSAQKRLANPSKNTRS
jgi:hypothetical protein